MIIVEQIKALRVQTHAPLIKCKEALILANGNLEEAKSILHRWVCAAAAETFDSNTKHGIVKSYVHNDRVGVLVEVRCETQISAESYEFHEFCEQLMLQIAGTNALYLTSDSVPEEDLEYQIAIFKEQIHREQTKEKLKDRCNPTREVISDERMPHVINGRIKKWYSEVCLMHQKSIMVPKKSIEDLRVDLISKMRENVMVKRFVRFEVGE